MKQPSNMLKVVLDPLKPRIACQDPHLTKSFDLKNKSKPFICSVYYHSRCCMEAEKLKNSITRKKEVNSKMVWKWEDLRITLLTYLRLQ